jgi:hypothetical protein
MPIRNWIHVRAVYEGEVHTRPAGVSEAKQG